MADKQITWVYNPNTGKNEQVRFEHFNLRDPSRGEEELTAFKATAHLPGAISFDDSGLAEGQDVSFPRAIGLGTVIFLK